MYVDVDDTLVRSFGTKRVAIAHMVELVRALHGRGAELYCWSTAGAAYARTAAEELGVADCFAACLPKPRLLLDDVLVNAWKLQQLHPSECQSVTAEEMLSRLEAGR